MPKKDVQQICLNGHQITDTYHLMPDMRKNFCAICGAKTITKCLNCNSDIPGRLNYSGTSFGNAESIPRHCENCGTAFPWTEKQNKKLHENIIKLALQKHKSTSLDLVRNICSRFHIVASQLKIRHASRLAFEIQDEYDVQDLLLALLKIFFDDIRPEEWTPSYAGKCSRADFLLKKEQIVIEVKKTRKGLGARELGDELIIDAERYKSHPNCKVLYCFVYDPDGKITNQEGFERDLSRKDDNFNLLVHVVPKGY